MKKIVPHLKLDHKVWALVEEVNGTNLIINFQGDLIRVGNQAGKRFRPGQRIQLLVVSIQPLGFKLIESTRSTKNLDITI